MVTILNDYKRCEEIQQYLSRFSKLEQEEALHHTLLFGISILIKYHKLNLPKIKLLAKSSQKINFTEQTVDSLQNKIQDMQKIIADLNKQLMRVEKLDKSTETLPTHKIGIYSQPEENSYKRSVKQVDFWNQTDKENTLVPTRSCWKRNTEMNWMQDFSDQVKKIPNSHSPIIRESRISILSNQDKAKC